MYKKESIKKRMHGGGMSPKERKQTNHVVPFGFSIKKGKGVWRWFPHCLSRSSSPSSFLLRLSLFFCFFFLFFLVFSCSFIVCLVGELHGTGEVCTSLYFFLGFFFAFHFSLFSFLVPLLCHNHGPRPCHRHRHRPHGGLASWCHAPMVSGRCGTLYGGFSCCDTVLGS